MSGNYKPVFLILVTGSFLLVNCEENKTVPELLKIEYTVENVSAYGKSDGLIDLTVTGGISPYQYNWSNGSVESHEEAYSSARQGSRWYWSIIR